MYATASQAHRSEQNSSSPDNEWEEWMDWDPKPRFKDQEPTPPSETMTQDGSKRSSMDDPRPSDPSPAPNSPATEPYTPKKRKLTSDTAQSRTSPQAAKLAAVQNRSHSLVEKRYRTNLNDKIADLRKSIPSLRDDTQSPGESHVSTSNVKINKATVLVKAIEYIRQLETRNAFLEDTNDALRRRACHVAQEEEREVESTPKEEPQSPKDITRKPSPGIRSSGPDAEIPRGMIHVPEEIRRLREVAPQQHYADDARFNNETDDSTLGSIATSSGRVLGKLMVGSLAGLMIMDRIAGSPKQDRGLFALPFLDSLPKFPLHGSFQPSLAFGFNILVSPLVKGFLVFSFLGILLFLYLFTSKPKLGKPLSNATETQCPQYSNSPMEIRQNAWLTSIQTVWVPSHSILPEMWALIRETHAYMTRYFLGWRSYSWLTGRSEEEETARVRAWEIALDAQLTGGDRDLSKGRLVLTLWAAGTLPKTPARVMLKALHIRIMFWEASSSVSICNILNSAASSLARYQWKHAQGMLKHMETEKAFTESDLPDHLSALLQSPCERIMTDDNVHRAHNLAWNGPAVVAARGDVDLEYLFEEDTAMRGPLDILALWCCSLTLQETLGKFIHTGDNGPSCMSQVSSALLTAPPGSSGSIRALAAQAVLSGTDLVTNMALLLEALPLLKANSLPTSLADLDSLPKAIQNDVMVTIECAEALIMVLGAENDPGSIQKALCLLNRALPTAGWIGLLGFAAILRLLQVLLGGNTIAINDRSSLHETLRSAIRNISDASEQSSACFERGRDYTGALQKFLPRDIPPAKRRESNVSIDSGYWSLYDERTKV
ncbi:hypothetical protein MMC21_000216 [Puttea exsequens]|nr:hypothetical protein [Puttea exsequens]